MGVSDVERGLKLVFQMGVVTIGFFLFDGVQPLDFIGPWDVFDSWKQFSKSEVQLLTFGETKDPVTSPSGLTFQPSHSIEDLKRMGALSCLVIPGGQGIEIVCKNDSLVSDLALVAQLAESVLTVCTGSFLLQATGLLKENAKVATYWRAADTLRQKNVIVEEERVVQAGKIWSAGGVTSGIDAALAYLAAREGREAAGEVQLRLEYFPVRVVYANETPADTLTPYRMGGPKARLPAYIRSDYFSPVL